MGRVKRSVVRHTYSAANGRDVSRQCLNAACLVVETEPDIGCCIACCVDDWLEQLALIMVYSLLMIFDTKEREICMLEIG